MTGSNLKSEQERDLASKQGGNKQASRNCEAIGVMQESELNARRVLPPPDWLEPLRNSRVQAPSISNAPSLQPRRTRQVGHLQQGSRLPLIPTFDTPLVAKVREIKESDESSPKSTLPLPWIPDPGSQISSLFRLEPRSSKQYQAREEASIITKRPRLLSFVSLDQEIRSPPKASFSDSCSVSENKKLEDQFLFAIDKVELEGSKSKAHGLEAQSGVGISIPQVARPLYAARNPSASKRKSLKRRKMFSLSSNSSAFSSTTSFGLQTP
jgi:hypothetical protein